MNRIFNREEAGERIFAPALKTKIGVFSMCRGAGASFVAQNLAWIISQDKKKSCAFVDAADYLKQKEEEAFSGPSLYDSLGMDKRFALREYIDLFELVQMGESIRGLKNIDENINWAVPKPRGRKTNDAKITPIHRQQICLRVINNIYADIVVCDIGACTTREEMKSFAAEMDCIIFVIDPMPSKLIAGYNCFSEMRKIELEMKKDSPNKGVTPEFIFVLNKMNVGANRKEVFSYLKLRNCVEIPVLEPDFLYEAEYRCKIPFAISGVRKKLSNSFEEIHSFITHM